MNLLKTTAVLACLMGTPLATADIYQWTDCDGNGTLLLTELDAEPWVDLSFLYLGCADLEDANLMGANLSYADLSQADLTSANLYMANLSGADLFYADLAHADVRHASLVGANLIGTTLFHTLLNHADLQEADLSGAILYYAILDYADLSGANLSYVEFWGSASWSYATYDEDTIFPEGMDPDVYGLVYVGPPATGACCLDDGTCSTLTEENCVDVGGSYKGDNSDCDTVSCNTGACCFLKEFCYWECLELSEEDCMAEYAATWHGIGSRCDDITCPDPCVGACCLGGSQCVLTVQALCEEEEGTFHAYEMCVDIECELDANCPGDLNGDGAVNILDLLLVINYWGVCL